VHTTVAHIATEAGSYVLSDLGVVALLKQMLAFLLTNGLAGRSLMVFVDGQRNHLHTALVKALGCWRSWQVILDWYQLEKRCRENLNLALKGRLIRKQVLEHLLALLWDGRVGSALEYLAGLASEQIKNAAELAKLIGYLQRQRPHIPCYSVRKQLVRLAQFKQSRRERECLGGSHPPETQWNELITSRLNRGGGPSNSSPKPGSGSLVSDGPNRV